MKRTHSIIALFAGVILILASSNNPPNGHTGAPGDQGLCSDCHTLNTGMQDGTLVLTGFPSSITPNSTYMLTITNSNPNGLAALGGFQMTILNSNNQKAGDFVVGTNDPNSAITNFGGRQYWEHDPAQNYPPSNEVSWTVNWKAPLGPMNTTITYYAAGNVANGNGNDNLDLIITSVGEGMLDGGGSPLEVEITSFTDVFCNGGNSGSATATAMGGTPGYTYSWSNGGTGATVNNLSAGTYTVTSTDADASTATATVIITQPSAIILQPPVISHVTCFGGNNGSITANATGGVPPYVYNWSNGDTGSNNSGLTAGPYTVTVTDDNGCTKMATYTVTQPPLIVINLVNLSHESCSGDEDGSITISVTGGVNPIFSEWSNGFIGTTISSLAPGVYSVTVTDNNDCTKTASYTINPGGIVEVNLIQIQHVTCNGGNNGSISILATGGQAPYTYAWSNGMTGPSITNLTAGNYLVTVTDLNDCAVVELYGINQPAPIGITINSSGQNLCFGDSLVNLAAVGSGSNPPFTGSWSNGVQGLNNNNLPAGTYTVTITDNAGCTSTASRVVTSPPALGVTVSTTDETSSDANDGTATATPAGGTPGYTYLWSNGATTNSIVGLAPGSYSVTVTDLNGCTTTGSGQVDEFGCSLDVSLGLDVSICENDTITIGPVVVGANGAATYLWSDGSTGSTLQISSGGEYCVTVTDAANCQDVDCIVITEDDFPEIICPVIDESAPGLNNGAIQCDSVPGIVSYLWSNGETTASVLGLAPGEYCVTLTNAAGCTGSQCFIVQPGNCQLVITSILTDVSCAGDSTGSVFVNVENATPPVTYLWSNGKTTSSIEDLPAGTYGLTVSDGAGCGEILNFPISEPLPLLITVDSVGPITDFGLGLIFITTSGGALPYSLLWTDPSGDQFPAEDLNNLTEPGYYSVLLSDANGCTASVDSIFVEQDVAVDPSPVLRSLKVYPVPTEDILVVDLELPITEALISGVDGRLYKRIINPFANKLEVGDLEAGWYIIRMFDGQTWYLARMVK